MSIFKPFDNPTPHVSCFWSVLARLGKTEGPTGGSELAGL